MITLPLLPAYVWFLVFLRAGLVLTFFPLIGEAFVRVRVRIILAGAIAFAIAPVVPVTAAMFPPALPQFIRLVASEAFLGFGIGLIGKVMFAIVQYSGQIAGEQMGFGIINAIDPTGAHQISVTSASMRAPSLCTRSCAASRICCLVMANAGGDSAASCSAAAMARSSGAASTTSSTN